MFWPMFNSGAAGFNLCAVLHFSTTGQPGMAAYHGVLTVLSLILAIAMAKGEI